MPVEVERLRERLLHVFVEPLRCLCICHRINDAVLVAVELVERELLRQEREDDVRDELQHAVAEHAVERLIDDLEIIDAEHEHGPALPRDAIRRERDAQAVLELVFIEESRDVVRLVAVRHAADHAHEDRLRAILAERADAAARAQPDIAAAAIPHAVLHRVLEDVEPLHDRGEGGRELVPFLRVHQRRPYRTEISDDLRRQAEIPHEIRREQRRARLDVDEYEIFVRRALDEVEEELAAAKQRTQRCPSLFAHSIHSFNVRPVPRRHAYGRAPRPSPRR